MTRTCSAVDMVTGRHSTYLLCAIVDLVDDTKLVERTLLAELAKEAETLLTDPVACTLLLHLLPRPLPPPHTVNRAPPPSG